MPGSPLHVEVYSALKATITTSSLQLPNGVGTFHNCQQERGGSCPSAMAAIFQAGIVSTRGPYAETASRNTLHQGVSRSLIGQTIAAFSHEMLPFFHFVGFAPCQQRNW